MRITRFCALFLLLVVGSVAAFANGINDPKIIIQGASSGAPTCPHGCTGVGVNFSFTIPKFGSGTLYFTNVSGKNWTSLTLIETGVPASAISCVQSLFLSCTTKTLKDGSVAIILSGVKGNNPQKGILNGQSFSIGFACVDDSCWTNGGSTVSAHAGTVPEPGTIALMVTGLGGIFSRRKMWKNRFNS